jgi:long-chain acyl-CoA synthetase
MAGYWKQPDATHAVMTPDGWLRTGDAARADEQGYVWIVDRIADRFYAEGQPVYPADVERVLIEDPSIADAGVVQLPSEAVAAVVVPAAGSVVSEPELLASWSRRLPRHQTPTSVTFVDNLPRSSVGKLLRPELRALVRT